MYKIEFNSTMNVFQIIRISDNKIHAISYNTRPLAKKAVIKMLDGLVKFKELNPSVFVDGYVAKFGKKAAI